MTEEVGGAGCGVRKPFLLGYYHCVLYFLSRHPACICDHTKRNKHLQALKFSPGKQCGRNFSRSSAFFDNFVKSAKTWGSP